MGDLSSNEVMSLCTSSNFPVICIDLIFNLLGEDVDNKYKVIPDQLCMLYYMRDISLDLDDVDVSPSMAFLQT